METVKKEINSIIEEMQQVINENSEQDKNAFVQAVIFTIIIFSVTAIFC